MTFTLTKIPFPSNRISLLDIRNFFPERFTEINFPIMNNSKAIQVLDDMLYAEMLLASAAYDRTEGIKDDALIKAGLDRRTLITELAKCYETFGISKGKKHTEQLVRDFESQATLQATRSK